MLVAAVALAYANALRAPFVFDDFAAIVENPTIRDWRDLGAVLSPPPNTGVTGRPVVNLTLALNHAVGGLEPRGYHLFNIVAHVGVALLLVAVLRRTLGSPGLALVVGLLWAVHPLLTESVVCVVQRNEVLVAFFLLLTLYAFIRAADRAELNPRRWSALAVAACWLGMATKEVMVVAPVLVLLFDRTFVAGSFRAAWQARWRLHLGLASAWLLLAGLMVGSTQRGGTVGFGLGVSAWDYLLMQCRALVLYLKLAVWPYPLILDYGTAVERSLAAVWPQAALLLALAAATLVALRRAPAWGFLGVAWFALLAPSSSFIPLTTQTIAEHRFYLPLALVIVAGVVVVRRLPFPRAATAGGGAVLVLLLGAATHTRNRTYASELTLWRDTVAKAPANPRAHNNLGLVLFHAGDRAAAEAHYREALRLAPAYSPAYANLGDTLAATARPAEAVAAYETALRLTPEFDTVAAKLARLHHTLGVADLRASRVPESIVHLEAAVALAPGDAELRNNLGTALLGADRWAEARAQFAEAVRLRPDYARPRDNLARLEALERAAQETAK